MRKPTMMNNRRRAWVAVALAVATMLLTGCSTDDGEALMDNDYGKNNYSNTIEPSVFDGEWSVLQQVVDTARVEMANPMRLRLPERTLAGFCFADANDAVEPTGKPTDYYLQQQGYTANAQFRSFMTKMTSTSSGQLLYITGTIDVVRGGALYRITLLSTENGSVVYNTNTRQWTVAVPVIAFQITNTETQETTQHNLTLGYTFYYNTTKRIN